MKCVRTTEWSQKAGVDWTVCLPTQATASLSTATHSVFCLHSVWTRISELHSVYLKNRWCKLFNGNMQYKFRITVFHIWFQTFQWENIKTLVQEICTPSSVGIEKHGADKAKCTTCYDISPLGLNTNEQHVWQIWESCRRRKNIQYVTYYVNTQHSSELTVHRSTGRGNKAKEMYKYFTDLLLFHNHISIADA